jgi:NTP pyrophosphatase (non-canonical NTP hydrolase)
MGERAGKRGTKSAGSPPSKPAGARRKKASGAAAGGEIASLIAAIRRFRDARDWAQFHDAKNLAICLSVEAAELLEVFLWKGPEEIDRDRLKDELADVFYSALLMADQHGLDVGRIVRDKLRKNAAKYPIRKSKGSRKKYDEL